MALSSFLWKHREGNVRTSAILSGLMLAAVGAPLAQATDATLVAAAEKEGSVTVYACDPPQTPIYVERFKKIYPHIQVNTYIVGCWQLYNRHAAERQARRQAADVFFATEDVMSRMAVE